MRKYWLKVVFGALAVFAVGMIVVSAIRSGRSSVREIVDGTGPISIPLPSMVPFNLDGVRIGSIRRLTIYRSAAKTPSSLNVTVQLPDSISSARFANCILVADSLENIDEHTSFRCAAAADTAGKGFVPFGSVLLRGRNDTIPLLLPQRTVRDFTEQHRGGSDGPNGDAGDSIDAVADSIVDRAESRADSLEKAAEDAANRAAGAGERARASIQLQADSIRRVARQLSDSVRAAAAH
jgi:hypothetical protein